VDSTILLLLLHGPFLLDWLASCRCQRCRLVFSV
jgi:hypothetical protein